jgi:glucose/arabinose dehydrogenase
MTLVTIICLSIYLPFYQENAEARAKVPPEGPSVIDSSLRVELVVQELKAPTSMVFVGSNLILVTEKNTGMVESIVLNNTNEKSVLFQLNVSKADEQGLLGIAVSNLTGEKEDSGTRYVFLYYTEPPKGKMSVANKVVRYELVNGKLIAPKQLLALPAQPGPQHNGGKLIIGPDNNVYLTIGDLGGSYTENEIETKAQNYGNGSEPDGRAGILRISLDGRPVGEGIIGTVPLSNLYYAYGIKNSFGIAFDPITGKLWDTENGPSFGDEVNLVEPGFNSGWAKVQGIWSLAGPTTTEPEKGKIAPDQPQGVYDFESKGKYSPPKFTWDKSVAPTALIFLDSSKLGPNYKNIMLVGDAKDGNLYHFRLGHNRTSLALSGSLSDMVADSKEETGSIIFGKGFGVITDLKIGIDGNLYVLVYDKDDGRIYKIAR